jgi:hypothetical protein
VDRRQRQMCIRDRSIIGSSECDIYAPFLYCMLILYSQFYTLSRIEVHLCTSILVIACPERPRYTYQTFRGTRRNIQFRLDPTEVDIG